MGLENKVEIFMQSEMPQIKMHGGDWEIESFEDGNIEIALSDACDGCGISPMTIQAIKTRMVKQINKVESVDAYTVDDSPDPTVGPFSDD